MLQILEKLLFTKCKPEVLPQIGFSTHQTVPVPSLCLQSLGAHNLLRK